MRFTFKSARLAAKNRRFASAFVVALTLLSVAVPVLQAPLTQRQSYGIPASGPAPEFELRDPHGNLRSIADFRGKPIFLMFGYLNCDNVCHTQALLFEEINGLAARDDLAFVYIAIDPQRDTPQQVAQYFDVRGDTFVSLHGEDTASLQRIANQYRAYFSRRGGLRRDDYLLDHNAVFYLIGPDGMLKYVYGAGQRAASDIVSDLYKPQPSRRSVSVFPLI